MARGLKKHKGALHPRASTIVAVGGLILIVAANLTFQIRSFGDFHLPSRRQLFQRPYGNRRPQETAQVVSSSSLTGALGAENEEDRANPAEETIGLAVVHCKEYNTTFLDQVPDDWRPFKVYDTCGQNSHPNASEPFKNAGSEECTVYLDHVITNYDNLPDISIFIQADALRGYQAREGRDVMQAHTPFGSMAELTDHTKRSLDGRGFVHFGPPLAFFGGMVQGNNSNIEYLINETWSDIGLYSNKTTVARTRPGACFAVRKERILANKKEVYRRIQSKILASNRDMSRRRCGALENSWHAMFGEPSVLPISSSMDHIYQNITWKIW